MSSEPTTNFDVDVEVKGLGDRMKELEFLNDKRTPSYQAILSRYDGDKFSALSSALVQSEKVIFSLTYATAMARTSRDVLLKYPVSTVYVQSDEISIIFPPMCTKEEYDTKTNKSNHLFDGRHTKLISEIASYISVRFVHHLTNIIFSNPDHQKIYSEHFLAKLHDCDYHFDGRIVEVGDKISEVVNNLLWRSCYDCFRNCVSMYAHKHIGKKEVLLISTLGRIEMMKEKGFDFTTEVPTYRKYGTYLKKINIELINDAGEKYVRTRVIAKTFGIKYSGTMLTLILSKKWDEDLEKQTELNYEIVDIDNLN
jgi:tRNA(His) guanylyltransferase